MLLKAVILALISSTAVSPNPMPYGNTVTVVNDESLCFRSTCFSETDLTLMKQLLDQIKRGNICAGGQCITGKEVQYVKALMPRLAVTADSVQVNVKENGLKVNDAVVTTYLANSYSSWGILRNGIGGMCLIDSGEWRNGGPMFGMIKSLSLQVNNNTN